MAAEGALRPTPATIGSVTGLPASARTGQDRLTRPGFPRDVSLENIRWRHVGFGPARAVATVANVLAGASVPARLGWIARPAVRSPQSWLANCAGMDVPHHRLASGPCPCESDAGAHILRAITS